MVTAEHLKILKQGVDTWNRWRIENREIRPNLAHAILIGADVSDAKLHGVNLKQADLSGAKLARARLELADLGNANLAGAKLPGAKLRRTNLRGARLNGAYLTYAEFDGANVMGADFSSCWMNRTVLTDLDLSVVQGLETVRHTGPSEISISTIYRSKGKIPAAFLRGAGVPDDLVKYIHSLSGKSVQFYSCFISHSSKDKQFAERLYSDLQGAGVRCWFAPEDLKIGDKLRPSFDDAIRLHDKLVVLLSASSVESPWVEKEVETAFEKERIQARMVLFPIRLDDAVMETKQAWAADIRRTRHIGDFRNWKDHDSYKKAFERLLRDLKSEAKVESAAQSQ